MIIAVIILSGTTLMFFIGWMVALYKKSEVEEIVNIEMDPYTKVGIYRGEIGVQKQGTSIPWDITKVFTVLVAEKRRFGDKIEVKYLKLLKADSNYKGKILTALKTSRKLIPLDKVIWEHEAPDVVLTRERLRTLMNERELEVGNFKMVIDEDIDRHETLDIIIKETV